MGFRIDLGKAAGKVPGSKAAGKAAGVAGAVTSPLEDITPQTTDGLLHPRVGKLVDACEEVCELHINGFADLLGLAYENNSYLDVTLIRGVAKRSGGDQEICVRQYIPKELRSLLRPESVIAAKVHPEVRKVAVADWEVTGASLGRQLSWATMLAQFDWPDESKWPGSGTIEIRDAGRHTKKLEKRRAEWTPTVATLTGGGTRGGRTDSREDWKLKLDVPGLGETEVKSRLPSLVTARLFGYADGESKLGGMVTTVDTVARTGAPICVLVDGDDVAPDWEATLAQDELRSVEPL